MFVFWIIFALLVIAGLLAALTVYCYRATFYVPKAKPSDPEAYPLPLGPVYEPYHGQMIQWMQQARSLPKQIFSIRSHDGLMLYATYYECAPNAPLEIMFHGYRGSAERDLCGGVQRAFALGHNALVVNQRGALPSQGHVISFGVNERKDCRSWVDFAIHQFGKDVRIILTGISMGAATVLLAAGEELPENVVGVLADCGYSRGEDIIKAVIRKRNLPPRLVYPFVKLAAKTLGHFDLDEANVAAAASRCKVPVIFFHGEADGYVPCYMSKINYDACNSHKKLVTIPEADHGLAYMVDPQGYLQAARDFFGPILHPETE